LRLAHFHRFAKCVKNSETGGKDGRAKGGEKGLGGLLEPG